jgi:putative ABC transport system substrate-binding protein
VPISSSNDGPAHIPLRAHARDPHLPEAFHQGLRDLGYVEGRNVVIEYRDAEGKVERLPTLAAELVALNVDVIVAADIDRAFSEITRARTGALTVVSTPMFASERRRLVDLAAKNRLPTMFSFRVYVDAGGLMSYGPSLPDMFRRAATYVDKILKGAKPADLPVEQPTKFELVINLKTAKALGLAIPQSLLGRADHVIE